MYSFLVGDPGAGKSFLSCYLAATLSKGGQWADGSPCEQGRTLMFTSEDHLGKVVVPRLNAQDAVLDKIDICQFVK